MAKSQQSAKAVGKMMRTSPQKLNLVAKMIRGMRAEDAVLQLQFSPKRISNEVKKVLQSAIANAENNNNLDIDRLYVSSATVGKALVLKRFRARARGRGARIFKPYSNLYITVTEREEEI